MTAISRRKFGLTAFSGLAAAAFPTPSVPQVNAGTVKEAVALQLWNDRSFSTNREDLEMQREGTRYALTRPDIMSGLLGQKELLLCSGEFSDKALVQLDWTRISSQSDLIKFTDSMMRTSVPNEGMNGDTLISEVHLSAMKQFAKISEGGRKVLDISADGEQHLPNKDDIAVTNHMVISQGIECNSIIFPDRSYKARYPQMTSAEHHAYVVESHQAEVVTAQSGRVFRAYSEYDYAFSMREKLRYEMQIS